MKLPKSLIAVLLSLSLFVAEAHEEQIAISREWGDLRGTLALPEGDSDAVVLIIAGSGPTDRNGNSGTGLTTNAYYMLARALETEGIASLRYDKRGVGQSRYTDPDRYERESELRFDDYIEDAAACAEWLRERGFRKIIPVGHSEGALVALELATRSSDVAAVVSLAGAGYPIDEILQFQLNRELISLNPGMMMQVQSLLSQLRQGKTATNVPPLLQTIFRPSVQPYLISWMQYDPRATIRRVAQPVLILSGDNDIQISTDNAEALALAQPAARKRIIPRMTHLLKPSDETDPRRQKLTIYMDAEAPISEELVSAVTEFVRSL